MSFSGTQKTRLGAYGASRPLYGSFAARVETVAPTVAALTPGGIGHKRKKYPRRVFIDGHVELVRNAAEERELLRAMAERAQEDAQILAALGDTDAAQEVRRKAKRILARVPRVDAREEAWLRKLREDDDEILSILMQSGWTSGSAQLFDDKIVSGKTLTEEMLKLLRDEDEEIIRFLH